MDRLRDDVRAPLPVVRRAALAIPHHASLPRNHVALDLALRLRPDHAAHRALRPGAPPSPGGAAPPRALSAGLPHARRPGPRGDPEPAHPRPPARPVALP